MSQITRGASSLQPDPVQGNIKHFNYQSGFLHAQLYTFLYIETGGHCWHSQDLIQLSFPKVSLSRSIPGSGFEWGPKCH